MSTTRSPDFKEAVAYCEEIRDYVSRDLFAKILENEEEHVDFLESQLGLIEKMGLQNYIQSATGSVVPEGDD